MNIYLRDKKNNLIVKDILTVSFNSMVEPPDREGKYHVRINSMYMLDGEFNTQDEAEAAMLEEAHTRDQLEEELRNPE